MGRVVSVSFCSMCVQIFMSIAFVLLLLLLMLVGTICQSPLLLSSSYSCCSPCHSHSFKHFMIFYLFSSSLSVVFCMRCVVENRKTTLDCALLRHAHNETEPPLCAAAAVCYCGLPLSRLSVPLPLSRLAYF